MVSPVTWAGHRVGSYMGLGIADVLAACPGSTGDGEPEKALPRKLLETACSGWAAFSSHQANVGAGVSPGHRL